MMRGAIKTPIYTSSKVAEISFPKKLVYSCKHANVMYNKSIKEDNTRSM